jgi:glycerol dehydrogenase-like iron-containing ADH family enzyme
VLEAQARFLALTETDYDALKVAVLDQWDEIQAIAAEVPPPDAVARLLRKVGGPMTAQEAGLEERDLADGLAYAFYLRDRLPVLRLRRMLDLN